MSNFIVRNIDALFDVIVNNAYLITKVSFALVVGLGVSFIASRVIGSLFLHYTNKHVGVLVRKFVWYTGIIIVLITVLSELGYNIASLLGAAGVLGVAIGLASQTSLSNVVSGIFLLSEFTLKYNDLLAIGDIKGYVESIDLLAIKLRTSDNRLVRIPNENLIKNIFINESFFDKRRFDFTLVFQTNENVPQVISVIVDVIQKNEHALKQPEPFVLFDALEGSGIKLLVGAWAQQDHYVPLKKTLLNEIKERFEAEKIDLSCPQLEVTLQSLPDIGPQRPG